MTLVLGLANQNLSRLLLQANCGEVTALSEG
jgi:hypothetical protein